MARVLLAWELGAGFGHLVTLRALARLLRERGHECAFAVRMLGNAAQFLEPELGPVWQAPLPLGAGRNPVKTQVSYASLLHNTGFDDPAELAGRLRAWRELLRTLRIDHLVAEHAPAALLAARTLGLRACHVGTGFTVPPLRAPFPSFRPRMSVPDQVLAHNDAQVLAEANAALARLELPPLARLQDLLAGALSAVLSYPELDHYEGGRPEPHLGLPDHSYGEDPQWPAGDGPRVFAYLRPMPALPRILEGLKASRARVLLRISELPPEKLRDYLRPGMAIVERSIHFRRAAETCDAFVNYGAHSTVAEFLLAGKPGVLTPDLHERVLVARRAAQLGAVHMVRAQAMERFGEALAAALDDPAPRAAAERFAKSAASVARERILPALVERVLAQ